MRIDPAEGYRRPEPLSNLSFLADIRSGSEWQDTLRHYLRVILMDVL